MRHQIVDALTYGARCCIIIAVLAWVRAMTIGNGPPNEDAALVAELAFVLGAVLAVGAGVASTAGRWEDEP